MCNCNNCGICAYQKDKIRRDITIDCLVEFQREQERIKIRNGENEELRNEIGRVLFPKIRELVHKYDEIIKINPETAREARDNNKELNKIMDGLTYFISYYK